MADVVHHRMEQMLPPLEDLERRGLFSRQEIKQIIKKRHDFEYLLKRRALVKEDFLRYLNHESQLEALRVLRKRAILRNLKAKKLQWKRSPADGAIINHLVFIYERAVTKFKGDLRLWMMYLEFCREQNLKKQIRKVLAKALQYHPTVPGLWMYAASYDFGMHNNILSARAQMQRGLRMCPKSELMWLEYFKMELTYLAKLQARRKVLGIAPLPKVGRIMSNEEGDGGEDDVMQDDDDDGGNKHMVSGSKTLGSGGGIEEVEEEEEGEEDEEEEWQGEKEQGGKPESVISTRLAKIIYGNAIASIPDSLNFRRKFLAVVEQMPFDGKEQIEEDIYASLAKDFRKSEEAWDCRARRWVSRLGMCSMVSVEKGIQVFEDALKVICTCEMFERYACFLDEAFNCIVEGRGRGQKGLKEAEDMAALLLRLCERAGAAGADSNAMFTRHVRVLLNCGRDADALAVAARACENEILKKSGNVWGVRFDLEMLHYHSLAMNNADANEGDVTDGSNDDEDAERYRQRMATMFDQALSLVPLREAMPLWGKAIRFFRRSKGSWDKLMKTAEKALASDRGGADLAIVLVDSSMNVGGIQGARQTYNRLLALPGASLELYQHCIHIEIYEHGADEESAALHIQRLFDMAVAVYGKEDAGIWLDYCEHKLKVGDMDGAGQVHWKAKKMLKNPQGFLEGYQRLQR